MSALIIKITILRIIIKESTAWRKTLNAVIISLTLGISTSFCQVPILNYSTPQTYTVGNNIATLLPYNSGGAVSTVNFGPRTALTGATFSGPSGMVIDASGNLYITNYLNNTISKFSASGAYLGVFGPGTGSYTNPVGIVFDSSGNAYVLNTTVTLGNGRVDKYNSAGVFQGTIISGLLHALGFNIDRADNLYITDRNTSTSANSVTKYSKTGTVLLTLPTANLNYPDGVVVDGSGNIFVINRLGNNLTKYDASGAYLGVFASGFNGPLAVSIDAAGNIYVGDSGNNRIQAFSPTGLLLKTITPHTDPEGTISDAQGNLYAGSYSGNAVYKYPPIGGYAIDAPLPAGLIFNPNNGQITGTPTAVTAAKNYTITGYNASGSANTVVSIGIASSSPTIPVDINSATNTIPENSANGTLAGLTAYSSIPTSNNTTNIALNKPVTVTSLENGGQFPASGAVDNDPSTRWSSAAADPQDLTIDLGSNYDISRVTITWQTAYATNYEIQVSKDGATFITLRSIYGNTSTNNDNTNLAGINSIGRYLRIHGTKRATGFGYSIIDMAVYPTDITYTLTNSAGGRFAIDPVTGIVTVANGTLLDYENNTSHTITVQAANTGSSLTASQNFTIAVTNVNEAPVITFNGGGPTAIRSVAEYTTAVTTVTATDVDAGSSQTYSISGGADAAKFNINTATGALTFLNPPNYAAMASAAGNNSYIVIVSVSDGLLSASQTLTINVTNSAYLSPYAYRIPLTLNTITTAANYNINTNQSNFPVLIRIADPSLVYTPGICTNKVQYPNGPAYDLAFTNTGSTAELNYQVESYDQVNGVLLVWVQVPTLTYQTNNTLYFYFGSPTAPANHTAAFYQATWDSNFKAVFHFNEPTFNGTVIDGTAGATHNGTTTGITGLTAGKIGNAYAFDGATAKIVTSPVTVTGPFTLSAWIKLGATGLDQKIMTNQGALGGLTGGYKLAVFSNNIPESESGTAQNRLFGPNPTPFTTNVWHYVQAVYSGTTLSTYVDGVQYKIASNIIPPTASLPFYIGVGGGGNSLFFNGVIDEPRVSGTNRSTDWIAFEYANQNNPAAFTTTGAVAADPTNVLNIPGGVVYTYSGGTYTPNISGVSTTPSFNGKESFVFATSATLAATSSVYGVTVNSGAVLAINGQALNVGCNVTNNGNITYGTTTSNITFNGSATSQTYVAGSVSNTASFGRITLNNSAGGTVTFSGGPIDVYNLLTLTSGNLVVASSATLTLKSTANLTASVPTIASGSTLTGTISAERYMSGGVRGYRLISAPVATTALLNTPSAGINSFDLKEIIKNSYVSGPGTPSGTTLGTSVNSNGFDYSPNNNPSIFVYKESDQDPATRNINVSDYKGFASISEYVPMGNGILYFFRGDRTLNQAGATSGNAFVSPYPLPNPSTLKFVGTVISGDVQVFMPNFKTAANYYNKLGTATGASAGITSLNATPFIPNLSYTGSNSGNKNGFNLIGNPYPSTIDLEQVQFTGTSAYASVIPIFTLNKNGAYSLYLRNAAANAVGTVTGTSANGGSRYVLSGEGFFVKCISGNAGITFKETSKTAYPVGTGPGGVPTVFSLQNNKPLLRIKLLQDSVYNNETLLTFNRINANTYSEMEDVPYLSGPSQTVFLYSITSDNYPLVYNQMSSLETVTEPIKLYVEGPTTGIYSLQFNGTNSIDPHYRMFLKDAFKKDSLEITANYTYNFNIDRTNSATYGASRFTLVMPHSTPGTYQLLKFTGVKTDVNTVKLAWETKNESTVITFGIQKSIDGGKTFLDLGTVQSAGLGTYYFTDNAPVTTLQNMYRLKQADVNDVITYAEIVTIAPDKFMGLAGNTIMVYPNPAREKLNVDISQKINQPVEFQIINSNGKLVKKLNFERAQHFEQNISDLMPGAYIINVFETNSRTKLAVAKFIKI
ncbi:hypothetical protein A0256_24440 [Mucilaginibacter sp. PAMC 26640]|nr:hypothetical protein A0256_24440 [Mucilaginibacter sp. PAMC 26640]